METCDAGCPAWATFVSTMPSGLRLYWCNHHANRYASTNPVTIKRGATVNA